MIVATSLAVALECKQAMTRRGMFTFATDYLSAGGRNMVPDEEWKH
jgi:hypothetical protein